MNRKYFFNEYDQYLPIVKHFFKQRGYQFVEIDNHFCFINKDRIYWHILNQPLKDTILNVDKRKQRADRMRSLISPLRQRFNCKYLNIAKQVFSMQFRHMIENNTIYLTEQFNIQYPIYVINIQNSKYHVVQINKDVIQQFRDSKDFQVILNVAWSQYEILIQNQPIIKNIYNFNKQQLYNFFVNKLNMSFLYFKNIFHIQDNFQYEKQQFNGFDVFIKSDYKNKKIIGKVINILKCIFNKFKRMQDICIIFQNSLKQNQGEAYGNCVDSDIYDYIITLTDLDPQYVILHELGHLFQFKYLNDRKINMFYEYFMNHRDKFKYYDNEIIKKKQFVAQLFAQYYMYNYNKQFCEEFLFGNT